MNRSTSFMIACLALSTACGGANMETTGDASDRACRRIDAEDDGFGGVVRKVRIWDDFALENGTGILELTESQEGVSIGVGVALQQVGGLVLPAGSTFEIRFADGTILDYVSDSDVEGAVVIGWGVATTAIVPFVVDAEELRTMAEETWAAMRVTLPSGAAYSMTIDDGDASQMQTAARCFGM
jgi:hypothetical protein